MFYGTLLSFAERWTIKMEKSKNLIVLSGTILSIRENKKNTVLIVKSKGESKEANVEFVFYDTSVLKGDYSENESKNPSAWRKQEI